MLESFIAALVLAAVFFAGWRLNASRGGHRAGASAAAGASVAYVFIYMLPELNEAGRGFVETTKDAALLLPEYHVYNAALLGFVLFYGLDHLTAWSRHQAATNEEAGFERAFWIHISAYAIYAALVSATMVESTMRGDVPLTLFCLALGLHFLSATGELVREHGTLYVRLGRHILAAAVMGGWLAGAFVPVSRTVIFTLFGFVSGGVVVNSMIMELPPEKDGRFWPFVAGAGAYALLLLSIAHIRLRNT